MKSHTAWKRVNMYLFAALMMALTVAVPAGTLTAHAASLNHSTPSAQLVPSAAAATPAITLNPSADSPSKPFVVKGKGFAHSVQVNLDFQGQFATSAITSSTGAFSAQIIVPEDPGGDYSVTAQETSGQGQAQATFTIIAGFSLLKPRNHGGVGPTDPLCIQLGGTPPPGHPLKLGVWGVPASVSYDVRWWNEAEAGSTVVASGDTTSSGTFLTHFQVPAEPAGYYRLVVEIASQPIGLDAIYYSGTYSCFSYNEPGDGSIHYQWDGVGWDANSAVTFNINGSQIQQTAADTQGSFGILSFTQKCLPPGTYQGVISGTVIGQPFNIALTPGVTVGSGC